MAWSNITDGEAGSSVRGKLNTLGADNDLKAPLANPFFTGRVNVNGAPTAAYVGVMCVRVATDQNIAFRSDAAEGLRLESLNDAVSNNGPLNLTGNTTVLNSFVGVAVGSVAAAAINSKFMVRGGSANFAPYTVATLPAAPQTGDQARVTDASAPVFGSTVAGGGAVNVPVFYNGSNWIVG